MSGPPQQPEKSPAEPAAAEKIDVPTLAPAASELSHVGVGRGMDCSCPHFFILTCSRVTAIYSPQGRDMSVALQSAGARLVCQVRVRKDGEQPTGLLQIHAEADLKVDKLLEMVQASVNRKLGMDFKDPTRPGRLTPCIPEDHAGFVGVR